jgi:hypothetical protein
MRHLASPINITAFIVTNWLVFSYSCLTEVSV